MKRILAIFKSYLNDLFLLIILVCCMILLFSSCRSTREVVKPVPLKDSVRIEVRERIVYEKDTVILEVPAQSAQNATRDSLSHLETDFAESDARVDADGTLHHNLKNKPQKRPTEVDRKTEVRDSIVYVYKDVPVPTTEYVEVEKKLSFWQKMKMHIGGIVSFILILWGIWKIYRIIRRF